MDIIDRAIKQHGAKKVYDAAYAAMGGNKQPLLAVGLNANTVADMDDIGRHAFKALTAREKASDYWERDMKTLKTERLEEIRATHGETTDAGAEPGERCLEVGKFDSDTGNPVILEWFDMDLVAGDIECAESQDAKIETPADALAKFDELTEGGIAPVEASNLVSDMLADNLTHVAGDEWPAKWPLDRDYGDAVVELSLASGEQDFVVDVARVEALEPSQ